MSVTTSTDALKVLSTVIDTAIADFCKKNPDVTLHNISMQRSLVADEKETFAVQLQAAVMDEKLGAEFTIRLPI